MATPTAAAILTEPTQPRLNAQKPGLNSGHPRALGSPTAIAAEPIRLWQHSNSHLNATTSTKWLICHNTYKPTQWWQHPYHIPFKCDIQCPNSLSQSPGPKCASTTTESIFLPKSDPQNSVHLVNEHFAIKKSLFRELLLLPNIIAKCKTLPSACPYKVQCHLKVKVNHPICMFRHISLNRCYQLCAQHKKTTTGVNNKECRNKHCGERKVTSVPATMSVCNSHQVSITVVFLINKSVSSNCQDILSCYYK